MTLRLTGLIAAAYTPFDSAGQLNESVIDQLAEHYLTNGVKGVFVGGTTGESLSLTVDERKRITRRWMQTAGGRLKIVAHVGCDCLPDAVALAAAAADAGVDAIASMAPCFFRPANVTELAGYLGAITGAAPATPFYYYDIPSMTGVALPTNELLALADSQLPTLNGVKFTRNDNMLLQTCLAADCGRFDILFGHDENLLTGLALGCHGAIGSTYNYAAPLYVELLAAFDRGDLAEAQRLQQMSVTLVHLLVKYGGVRTGKEIMRMIGIDCGDVRLPLASMSAADVSSLRADLEAIGYFDNGIYL